MKRILLAFAILSAAGFSASAWAKGLTIVVCETIGSRTWCFERLL